MTLDTIWIERFWKSLKYDYIYLNPVDDGFVLFEGFQSLSDYYHDKVHHTSQTPNIPYEQTLKEQPDGKTDTNLNLAYVAIGLK